MQMNDALGSYFVEKTPTLRLVSYQIVMNTHTVAARKKPKIRIDARYGFRYYVLERSCTFSYSEIMIFV